MPTKIRFSLSESSISSAIKQVQAYKTELDRKCELFCRRLTELGRINAGYAVSESPMGKHITVTTDIQPEPMGCRAVVIGLGRIIESQWQTKEGIQSATVSTILMVEFGAGSYGTINPKAAEMGYGQGTFPGQTHAFEPEWSYMDLDGNWHTSSGVMPTMPMYLASTAMIANITSIAREVFRC